MEVPNLPGFRSNKQPVRTRPQNFQVINGQLYEKEHPIVESDHVEKMIQKAKSYRSVPQKQLQELATTKTLSSSAAAAQVPLAVELEKQVLRAFAYYDEEIQESPFETYRVHKVQIQLFLQDMTIMLLEEREENSGIPQGVLLKRHAIPKPQPNINGEVEYYDHNDLFIGNQLVMYGRRYTIYDVDNFTRAWYAERGIDQGPPADVPRDAAAAKAEFERTHGPKKEGSHGKTSYPQKQYMEASLGKFLRDPVKMQQFLYNDRKVLRFDAIWDDTKSLYGDVNHYVVHFFLADDSVEVNEVHFANSGKDRFPTLLKRQQLPKQFVLPSDPGGFDEDAEAFYRPKDLIVGRTINVFGRDLLLRACDPFTRSWFQEQLGITQPENIVVDEDERRERPRMPTPPYTGFGSEEDSLASTKSLVPKPPKKNFNQLMDTTAVHRFKAKFANPSREDEIREFIIQFYPADGTLGIYEPSVRNSGIVGGKFLARGSYKQPNGQPFTSTDFTVGRQVEIARRKFIVTEIDQRTAQELHM